MTRLLFVLPILVAGCAQAPFQDRPATPAPDAQSAAPAPRPAVLTGAGARPAALDTVSEAEKAEARAVAAAAPAGGDLGQRTVSLGDPADPGLWVKSDLVTTETPGTVRTGGGDAIAVTLRPLGSDGGSQISLSALQALGLPLTGLHPVTLARRS